MTTQPVSTASRAAAIDPPEPDLTPEEMIARAAALRPKLLDQQEETEERTYYSEDLHEEFLRAGFYRTYIPRRYGGYEFGVDTYCRVLQELARGCPNSAWCMGLAGNHALQIGSWFPEDAQAEIFGDGDFRAASVAMPIGAATRTADGWELNGKIAYASGIPYSTHYMGQAFMPDTDMANPQFLLFVAPKGEWTMLDDWGRLLGLKGSGSHSIVFDHGWIPTNWGVENTFMIDVDVSNGTPGLELHRNPMYAGRAIGPFTLSLAAITIGAAYCALDEYELMMETKTGPRPPMVPRKFDIDYQRWYGEALTKIGLAEAAVRNAAEQHMDICQRFVDEGIPFAFGDDMLIGSIAREAYLQAWETMQGVIWRTAGSSAAAKGERMERIFRDLSMMNGHRNTVLRDWAFRAIARERFGLPRE